MIRTYRLLGLLTVLSLSLAACGSNIKPGEVNVEGNSYKVADAASERGGTSGDSLTAGLLGNPNPHPTGKQLYKNSDKALDTNHDGLADDASDAK